VPLVSTSHRHHAWTADSDVLQKTQGTKARQAITSGVLAVGLHDASPIRPADTLVG